MLAARKGAVGEMSLASKQGAMAMAAGMVAVGAAVGVGLYKVADQFDAAYDTIRTETGAVGDELEALKDDFREVFANVPDDAATVGTAIAEVNKRLGLTGGQLQARTTQFLNLARVTGTDVKENIEAVSKTFKDWEVKTKDQEATLDGFFRISQKTGMSVIDLATNVQKFGSPLRQLGFSVGAAASMFGIFEAAGVNVQTLMPGFKMAISNVLKPTDDLKATMKDLGIDLKEGPEKAVRDFITTLAESKDPMSMASAAMDLFGKRAGSDMVEAIAQGRLNLGEMLKTFKSGGDTINDAAEDTMDMSEKLQILRNRGMLALEPIAMKLFDALTKLADGVIKLTEWFQGLPEPVRDLVGKAAMLAAGLIGLAFAISKVSAGFSAVSALMAANPYVIIIAATVALAVLIVKNWDKIKEFLGKTWNSIKVTAVKVWNSIKEFLKNNWKLLPLLLMGPLGLMVALTIKNWDRIKDLTGKAWSKIRDLITWPFRTAINTVKNVVGGVPGFLSDKWNSIRDGAAEKWGAIRDRITSPIRTGKKTVVDVITGLADWLVRAWNKIVQGARDLGTRVRQALIDAFTGIVDEIKGVLEDIKDLPGSVIGGIADKFSASVDGSPFTAGITSPSTGTAMTASPATSAGSAGSQGPAPQVNISFADGMGWLRDFVNIEIEGHGHEAGQVWVAGAGGV